VIRTQLEDRAGGTVARVTVDNPKKLNILTRETLRALVAEMKSLQKNAKVRVVVITGSGEKAFIGGADLETLGNLDPKSAREFITLVHEACAVMRDCPVPVVARINGYCLGAGLELAACCDFRISADSAMFGMPEVRLAIPSVVEAAMLPRIVGTGRARWLVMTGETIGAAEALVWGLVEKMVPLQHLDACVDDAVDALLAGDDAALRAQKRLCNLWEEAPLFEAIDVSIDAFAKSYETAVPNQRVAAFRSARKKK
jgi:enoyl-CoA hydratase/carnithine racemase